MISDAVTELIAESMECSIPYRFGWRGKQVLPGAHHSQQLGMGGAFCDFAPLMRYPDPRRIDLRMTLRDPFGALHVRRFEQRGAITVYVLADLSGSMGFEGRTRKMRLLAALSAALAISARQYGDRFGFVGCEETVREAFYLPASAKRGIEIEIVRRLLECEPGGRNVLGMIDVAKRIGGQRKLVFLISDFHLPLSDLKLILESLSRHDIVPVILRDSAETADLPRWGLAELRDLETGSKRLAVMRPALQAQWRREWHEREEALDRLCSAYGRAPIRLTDWLDPVRLCEALAVG